MEAFKFFLYHSTRFFLWLVFKIFVGLKVKLSPGLSLKKPIILASNHISLFDPFLIGVSFSFSSGVHPLCFMVDDDWISGFKGFIIKAWGGFPSYYGQGLKTSLKEPKRLLRKKENLLMFPQGERLNRLYVKKGKIGTAILSLTTNTPILPVKIHDSHPGSLINLFLWRRKIRISIGQVFYLSEKLNKRKDYTKNDFRKATEIIMKEINRLS